MDNELLSLLSPEQQQRAQSNALQQGLMQLGFGLLGASTGAPGQPKPRFGQILAQAGPEAFRAYQQGFEQTLKQIMVGQQLQDAQRKREQEKRQQEALQGIVSRASPDVQSRLAAFPGSAESVLFPQEEAFTLSPGQARFRGAEQVAGLPDKPEPASPEFRNYQQAVAQGYAGSFVDYQKELKAAGRPQVSATATAGGDISPFMKKSQEAQATRFSDISISGDAARRSANDIRRLDDLIGKVETGGAAAFKQAAGNLGIKTEGLDDIQAAQAIINKLVPAQRPPGSGPMSDADLELFKQSLPRVINQPGANREIIRGMKEINQYLVKEGEIADMVLDGSITPAEGRKRLAALGNPVQDFFSRTQQPAVPTGVRVRRVN